MDTKRNTVLVTIDSLRADRCGFLGGADTMSAFDQLAEDGLAFENAIAPGPTTLDSVPPTFTGEFPIDRTGDPARGLSRERIRQHMRSRSTIAERFAEMGYETGGFTANPWTSRFFEFDAGFDHFEDFMDTESSRSMVGGEDGDDSNTPAILGKLRNWREGQNMFMKWEAFYDDIQAWVRKAEEPFFLWVFLVDAHMPYLPPAEYRTGSRLKNFAANAWLFSNRYEPLTPLVHDALLEAYDDCVRYTDAFIRRLHDDLGEDTPIVIHADHGDEFGDHGDYGHGQHFYEEVLRVPLAVANAPTGRVEHPVSLRRIPELLTDLAVGDDPRETGTVAPRPYVRSRNWDPRYVLRGENWKYVRHPADDDLYNLSDGETPLRNDDLTRIGRRLTRRWRNSDMERRRIVNATDELTRNESV